MPDLPNTLALTSIATDAEILSATHNANYSALQTAFNALKDALSGGTTGQFLRATDSDTVAYAYPPGYAWTYDEFTAPVGAITGTTAGTATTVKTSSSFAFDGTAVWVEFFSPLVTNTVDTASVIFELFQDTTDLGTWAVDEAPGASGGSFALLRRRITPSAASHTFTVKAFVTSGTGVVNAGLGGVGANVPGYILVTKA